MPTAGRRFKEDVDRWLNAKQSQGKYLGRNGYEARRFLRHCADWLGSVSPERVTEENVWTILNHIGGERRPKTMRFYVVLLDGFLTWCGNPVVRFSDFKSRFANRAVHTPVIPEEDRAKAIASARGPERVVMALLAVGRRKIEVVRARVSDFHVETHPPTYSVRQKGGSGEITDAFVLTPTLQRELDWYLPLRRSWAESAVSDSGFLICRGRDNHLVGVSTAYVDRTLRAVQLRAGVPAWPPHAYRRSAATIMRAKGADWEDVSLALGHRSPETTRQYVEPLVRRDRVALALGLLDPVRLLSTRGP
jgi:integrase